MSHQHMGFGDIQVQTSAQIICGENLHSLKVCHITSCISFSRGFYKVVRVESLLLEMQIKKMWLMGCHG